MAGARRRRAAALALAVGTALAGPLAVATEDQKIQRITEAVLLDGAGRPRGLSSLTRGKITLLTFFYTYCVDPLGAE